MKLRRWVSYTAILLLMVIAITACAKKVAPPPPPPPAPPAAPAPPPPPPPPAPPTEDEIFSRKTLDQLNAEMPLAEVHFAYDMSTIKDDQRPILQKNADYMRRWTSIRVTVEGHADMRGTSEYNLALGERRATAVKEYLVGLGIAGDRLVVVSKGKETPICTDETESCYERNRRGLFVITAK